MPIFEFEEGGKTFRITAADVGEAERRLDALQNPKNVFPDVLASTGSNLMTGGINIAGLPGLGLEYGARGINAAVQGAVNPLIGTNIPERAPIEPPLGGPEQLKDFAQRLLGPEYIPTTKAGEGAGTIASYVPAALTGPGGVARRLLTGAVAPGVGDIAGGELAAGTPYEGAARVGGAVAGSVLPTAVSRAITPFPMEPWRERYVNTLRREGVEPTAGQTTGNQFLSYAESTLGNIPFAGGRGQRMFTTPNEQFSAAALRSVGENATRAEPEVLQRAFTRLGGQFDTIGQNNVLRPGPQFGADLRRAIDDYRDIVSPPNRAPVIANFEEEIAQTLARNNGSIPGEAYQSLRSRMGEKARGTANIETRDALYGMQNALDEAMEAHLAATGSPNIGLLRETRTQYRNLLAIERAITGAGSDTAAGLISPAQLRTALVQQSRHGYALNRRPLDELAHAGEVVLKPPPQSGTTPRALTYGVPAGIGAAIGGMLTGGPGASLGTVLGAAAPSGAGRFVTSPRGQAYLGNQSILFQDPGAGGRAFRNALIQRQAEILQDYQDATRR